MHPVDAGYREFPGFSLWATWESRRISGTTRRSEGADGRTGLRELAERAVRVASIDTLVAEQLTEAIGNPIEEAARRLADFASHPEVRLIRERLRARR